MMPAPMLTGRWNLVFGWARVRGLSLALLILCSATTISLTIPAAAQAADPKAEAKALVQEGARLYDRGDFAGALSRFDQAYAKFPTAIIQFNRAQALRSLDRIVEACDAVERFLKEAIDAPVDRLREGQQLLQELQRQISFLVVGSNVDGAEVLVDGTQVGTTPLAKAVPIKPGTHAIVVQKSAMVPFRRSVDLAPGGRLNVDAQLVAAEPGPSPAFAGAPATSTAPPPLGISPPEQAGEPLAATDQRPSGHKRLGLAIGAAGIGGVVVGAVYSWVTSSKNNKAEAVCPGKTVCETMQQITQHDQYVSEAKDARTIAIIGFVAGGAALVTGAVLVLTAPAAGSDPVAQAHLTVFGGAGVAGLGVAGAW